MAITRRHCIQSLGLMALASATSPCLAAQLVNEYPWQALLGVSLVGKHDYQAEIEGETPTSLEGTLYRNGPGLFERSGYRKQHILDGDGMIQAIDLMNGRARYRNHFVRTPKYLREQATGRFLYPTWTTLAPEGMSENRGFLLSIALNGDTGKSFLAILDAAHVSAGPLALIHLRHHTPFSFHGTWLDKR